MSRRFFVVALLVASSLLVSTAFADPISIQIVSPGSPTVTKTGDGTGTGWGGTIGNFFVNTGVAEGTPPAPEPILWSTEFSMSTIGPGSVTVYITESDITTPVTGFDSLFDVVQLLGGMTLTEATYVDLNNGTPNSNNGFYAGTFMNSATFTGPVSLRGLQAGNAFPASGPYSETEVFTITANSAGEVDNASIKILPAPEPGSLALLGSGFLALAGMVRRRLHHS